MLKLVVSKSNPADIISRGYKPTVLMKTTLWSHGPNFLNLNESEWPNFNVGDRFSDTSLLHVANGNEGKTDVIVFSSEVTREITPQKDFSSNFACNNDQNDTNLSVIVSVEKFSSLNKLLRVTALVYKFIDKLRKKIEETKKTEENKQEVYYTNTLTNKKPLAEEPLVNADDMDRAWRSWVLDAQKSITTDQIKQLDLFRGGGREFGG